MEKNLMKKSELIKNKAASLGFSACGISSSGFLAKEEPYLKDYIENAYYGKLDYMAANFDKRLDTTLLVPGSKSVISVLLSYFPEFTQKGENIPCISKYAYGDDYHIIVKDKLYKLLEYINNEISPAKGRVFVGSAPVLEKARAVKAGLGWIGKNGLLINKELGSFFFIGELIIDMEIEYDEPYKQEYCGSCTKCLDACPTRSFEKPYVLNVNRCISYLTREIDDPLPEELREEIGNRIYGCDTCQDVCPWNQRVNYHNKGEFKAKNEILDPDIERLKLMDEEEFNIVFDKSAIKRGGFNNFKRNIFFAFPEDI